MKNLLLIRHAKSSWDNANLRDIDRPLNKRGERDAPFMAKLLAKNNIRPELIISSPAIRALTTAKIFAHHLNYPSQNIDQPSKLYSATTGDLLEIVNSIEESIKTVFVFGHNPELTSFSNYLSGKYIDNIPTCGIVKLYFKITWNELSRNSCSIDFFEYPKKYLSNS